MMSLDWSRESVEVDGTGQESLWESVGLAKGVCGSRQDWSRKSITTGLTGQERLWEWMGLPKIVCGIEGLVRK